MIDVKKLISGFLILATAAVFSGLILSFTGGSFFAAKTPAGPSIVGIGSNNNGFADDGSTQDSMAALQAQLNTSSTEAQANDPNNLTATLANSLVSGFVAANPDGIQTDSSGNDNVTLPDSQSLAATIANNPALQNFKAPNWDTEWENEKILVASDNSTTTIKGYLQVFNAIYQRYIGSTDIGSVLGDENASDAPIISGHAQEVITSIEAVPVPPSLMGFEARFIALLVYEKNTALVIQNESNDPIKATLILQAEQPKYDLAMNNFKTQWQKTAGGQPFPTSMSASLNTNSLQSDPQTSQLLSFVNSLFGIQTVYAQGLPVYDNASWLRAALTAIPTSATAGATAATAGTVAAALPVQAATAGASAAIFTAASGQLTVDYAALGMTIEKYAEDVALQIAVNTLTTLMQRKVLTWIQGSGAPRFVQDWGTELANSFTTAATNKLNSWMQCVPSYQAPTLKLLLTTPSVANTNACGSMFNAQLTNNLKNLQNRFTNFNDYLSLFQPGGNTWGLVMQVQDSAVQAAGASQQAKTTQSVAQQGWKGSAICTDGSNPNGMHTVCVSSDGKNYSLGSGETCDPSDTATPYFNNGSCADGSNPQTTSPGQVTGQSFSAAIKSGADNITSAKNIAGILNALTSSLLNSLSQAAISFSTQELNNVLNNTSGGATDSGLAGINPTSVTLASSTQSGVQCVPATQTASLMSNTLSGTSPTLSFSTGDYSASTTAVSSTVPSVGNLLNNSSSQASVSFSAAGGTLDTTCASGGACPSTEKSDGSPIYAWSAPGSLQIAGGATATGTSFFATYNTPGTYAVTVTASTDNSVSTCTVTVQPALSSS
jgi:hypothetical protein